MVVWHVAINRTNCIPIFDHHHLSDSRVPSLPAARRGSWIILRIRAVCLLTMWSRMHLDTDAAVVSRRPYRNSFPYDSGRVMDYYSGDIEIRLRNEMGG